MNKNPQINTIRQALNELESSVAIVASLGKFNKIKALQKENTELKMKVEVCNRSKAQYKSMYEKKVKECLMLKSQIAVLERRVKDD